MRSGGRAEGPSGPGGLAARPGPVAVPAVLLLALLAGSCGGPEGIAPGRLADSQRAREAWAGRLSAREDVGPALLRELAERGFFDATLCAGADSVWALDPGRPVRGYRLQWDCPDCPPGSDPASLGSAPSGTSALSGTPGTSGGAAPSGTPAPFEGSAAIPGPRGAPQPWPVRGSPEAAIARRIGEVLEGWAEQGHPLGRVRLTGHELTSPDSLVMLRLRAAPGPHVTVSDVRFEGRRATRRGFLLRTVGWEATPETYSARRWWRARETLLATGLFAEVAGPYLVRPPEQREWPDSARPAVLFRLREERVNQFSGLLGYSGEQGGLFGYVNLNLGNLFGTGRRVGVLWQAQRDRESRFELAWHEPFVWRLPLAADAQLTHVLEDTLYAETSWGADLLYGAGGSWDVSAGWSWSRLVLGDAASSARQRQTARFGVRRSAAGRLRGERGWAFRLDLASTSDDDETIRRARLQTRAWLPAGGWLLAWENDAALVTGADSLLRGDALTVGGAASVRGYFEAARRASRYLIQRTELGPRPSAAGARFYALCDVAWIREWLPSPSGLYGGGAGNRFLWSAGLGVEAPSRAGNLRLDYAVPGGEPIWKGRIHFGLVSRF